MAILKELSSVISKVEGGGTAFLKICVEMVKVLRSSVLRIILAKPATIVTIIAREINPPVKVLY